MNIRCPHCQTVFRVNPARIPPTGARAKCARCGETFTISPRASDPAREQTATPGPPQSAPPARPAPPSASAPPPSGQVSAPPKAARADSPAAAAPPAASRDTSAGPAAPSEPATDSASPLFGSRDPTKRAARIARALVSDIVAYHPERRDKSLADGSLRQEFRDEILKSWDEYVAQVGVDTAKSTPFFRDALNAILAKGKPIF